MHPFAPFITEEINELIFDDGSLWRSIETSNLI